MLLELIDDSPLYGKKGTIINNNILKVIPPKHHSLFKEHVRNEEPYRPAWRAINLDDMERNLQRMIDNARNRPNPFYDIAEGERPVNNENYEEEDDGDGDWDDEDDPIPYWDYDDEEEENEDIDPF